MTAEQENQPPTDPSPEDAEHMVTIVEAKPAEPYGHPIVGARCTCGWHGQLKAGPHATQAAEAEGSEHLRQQRIKP